MKFRDRIKLPPVKRFFLDLTSDYDMSKVSTITLQNTKKGKNTHGTCWPPEQTKDKLYKISAYVKADHDKYPLLDKHWFKINGKALKVSWKYDSVEEASVYILSHELFHYLSWTKQLVDRDGKFIKNTECNANWFAHGQVARFSQPLQIT
jgi:hypothetical protein